MVECYVPALMLSSPHTPHSWKFCERNTVISILQMRKQRFTDLHHSGMVGISTVHLFEWLLNNWFVSGFIPDVGDIMNKSYLLPSQTLHSRGKKTFLIWEPHSWPLYILQGFLSIMRVIKTSYWFILDLVYMRVLQGKGCLLVAYRCSGGEELPKRKRKSLMREVALLHFASEITLNLK